MGAEKKQNEVGGAVWVTTKKSIFLSARRLEIKYERLHNSGLSSLAKLESENERKMTETKL